VIPASAPTRRRGQARAATTAALAGLAALTGLVALAGLVAGCAASPAAPSPVAVGNVFSTSEQVTLQQVRTEISSLYSDHPGIASFSVQDVGYSASSRDTVLGECTAAGAGSQDAETGQIIACAPLIFFFYSYGKQSSVPAAVTLAGHLYWYAITHISGPLDPKTSLDELLQSWKLPVPGLTAAEQNEAVAASVINAASDTMLTQKSVRVVITDQSSGAGGAAGGTQQIVADIGTVTGTESITYGASSATIRITRRAAYFTGDTAGLTAYLGLSPAAAAKVKSRWVMIKSGTGEYQDLASENTISSLPSSILPSATDTAKLSTATSGGQKEYVLVWKATASGPSGSSGPSGPSGPSTAIEVRLTLTATPKVLPVSETLATNGETKTVTFSRWGVPFTVAAPAPVIPYSQIGG
jgi:hypothetical protein